MSQRSYSGPALDATYQHITERPVKRTDGGDDEDMAALEGEDELVYATDPQEPGEERTEGVPLPIEPPEPVDEDGQTRLEDWDWRAEP